MKIKNHDDFHNFVDFYLSVMMFSDDIETLTALI